jgi:integrase
MSSFLSPPMKSDLTLIGGTNMRKPTWKASHKAWYCVINGKQTRLGPSGPQNKAADQAAAQDDFYRRMADKAPVSEDTPAKLVLDRFLFWAQENRAPRTYAWYLFHLQKFSNFIGPAKTVGEVTPDDVDRWLSRDYRTAGPTHKNGACRAVARAFNWAQKRRMIKASPVFGMERPAAKHREECLTADQWKQVEGLLKQDSFADLIWFLRLTGCRPLEARVVEAKHWNRITNCLVLDLKDSKGKKVRRVIRLAGRPLEIVQRCALKSPEGPLFLNANGRAWKSKSVNDRFTAMKAKLGFAFFPYILRHTYITDALMRGVDPITLAALVGHRDAVMISRVYAHVAQNDEFLAAKARQAIGESA